MEELLEILEDMKPDVDFEACENLIESGILTSFDIVMLVTQIMQEFDIRIPADQIIPENFKSVKDMYALIQRMEEE